MLTTGTTCRALARTVVVAARSTPPAAVFRIGFACSRLFVAGENVTLVYPDLDTDDPVGRLSFRDAVIDIGTQGMKRHTPLAIPFGPGDLRAVQATGTHDLDALGTETHGILHRTLHRATEHDAALELLGDRIGNQLSVHFRLANLFDVHVDWNAHDALKVALEQLDILTFLADDDTRTRAEQGNAGILRRALDEHFRNGGVRQLLLEVLTDLEVLEQHLRIITARREPARVPVTSHREAEPGRMNLLSHTNSLVPDRQINMTGRLKDPVAPTLGACRKAFQRHAFLNVNRLYLEHIDIRTVVVLSVRDRRLDDLANDLRTPFRREGESIQRLLHLHAADLISNKPPFLGREPNTAENGFSFHSSPLTASLSYWRRDL